MSKKKKHKKKKQKYTSIEEEIKILKEVERLNIERVNKELDETINNTGGVGLIGTVFLTLLGLTTTSKYMSD